MVERRKRKAADVERLEFGCKRETRRGMAIVEGFLPALSRAMKSFAPSRSPAPRSSTASANMPLKRSMHSGPQAAYAASTTSVSPLLLKVAPASSEFVPEFDVVVDFAVEREDVAPARADHGLMTERRKIENGKAAVSECPLSFRTDPGARTIGSPMMRRSRRSSKRRTSTGPSRLMSPMMPHMVEGCTCEPEVLHVEASGVPQRRRSCRRSARTLGAQ